MKLLHPKHWLTWFFVGLAYLISWLPYPILKYLGKGLGKLLQKLAKSRVKVARRNLALSFPDMPESQREAILQANIESAGLAMIETIMGWWWPDWRIRRIGEVEGFEHVEAVLAKGKGVLGLATHNMSLEVGCRVAGLKQPSVAFYRRHDNPVIEFLQYRGRARSNRYLIHKRDLRSLFTALNNKEICFYLPDQDYGPRSSVFVPFFAVPEVATTLGPKIIASRSNCETVFIASIRTKTGYKVKFYPGLKDFPSEDDIKDMTKVNQKIEQMILEYPEQYLWMHKRYKTRPKKEDASLYS
ncbi:LpxL/LpxP family Kdo(2)-lipid IV(A) lauroyl/palmitoleoyl acyltransferase [Alteromonas sp. a30]|nr:LpxL/LpxP family Kdo(2)-lipid IV(A) lauroyl/palmitoleoyl acyltransferase [Alteromonas sp. a30]